MSPDDPNATDPRELARKMAEEAKARNLARQMAEQAKARVAAAAPAAPAPAPAAPAPAPAAAAKTPVAPPPAARPPAPAPGSRPRRNLTPEEAMRLALEEERKEKEAPKPAPKPAPAPQPVAAPQPAPAPAAAAAPRAVQIPLEAWLPNRIPGASVVRLLTVQEPRVFTALWQAHKARAAGLGDLHLLAAAEVLLDAVQRLPVGTLRAAEITWRDQAWVVWLDASRPAVLALTPDPTVHLAGL